MPPAIARVERPEPPGLADTAFRVVEAGQRVLLDRLDLARLDLLRLLSLGARTAVAMAAGTVLLAGAWCAIVIALALQLQAALAWPLPLSLTVVAVASAAAGIGVIALGLRRVGEFELSAIGTAAER
jgi:hypothetical protein